MQTETATGRSQTYNYYNCSAAQKGAGCANRRIPAHEFDDWLIDIIMDRILTAERIREIMQEIYELKGNWAKAREARRAALVKELRTAEGKRSKLFEVLELYGKDAPNMADLTVRLRQFNTQITG